jgi:hypothetical protein
MSVSVHGRVLQPWMGSAGPWVGSTGLSMDFTFFLFFYLINRGGYFNCLGKDLFTVTFPLRRL